ncbi:MAG: hypothetical protein M3552_09535 [Planctomycetota bacterium]|nr:hypothetical protein [Planctomycetaceae bacterium]MDQ3330881.1 hypothetical protein [Planctomycetota bacterium]
MRDRRPQRTKLGGAVACCVLAVIAMSLGPTGERFVRSSLRDASRPGLLVADWLRTRSVMLDMTRWPWTDDRAKVPEAARMESVENAALELEVRKLRFELAAARQSMEAFAASLGPVGSSSEVAEASVQRVAARVLARGERGHEPGGVILASGTTAGLQPNRIAVKSIELAVGEGEQFASHATVLAGAAVVGRTEQVGGWTATVLPVTDPHFRAHVTIVSMTSDAPRLGEQGIIEGDGKGGCVVKYVPSTATVAVGDHVYSFDPTGRIPQPLYYGLIEHAELRDAAPHWDIRLHPAADPLKLEHVHVLIPKPLDPSSSPDG